MSKLFYGSVSMSLVGTRQVEQLQVPTDDGADRVLTKWTLHATCWYNPAVMGYSGNAENTTAAFNRLPAQTDTAIREYLMQPRRKLIYTDDLDNTIVESPLPGYAADAKYGPFVERCVVEKIHGSKTWAVSISITTYLNECKADQGVFRSPLLAHRWQQTMDYDDDYFATRTTEGVAHFRTDVLLALGHYPDQYRRDLFFAIPNNYKRGPIHVEALSDGTGIRYRFVDVEKPLNIHGTLHANNLTRIEAFQTGGYVSPNDSELAAQIAFDAARAGTEIGMGLAFTLGTALYFIRRLPKYSNVVVVNVWGNRNSNRGTLSQIAIAIALSRIQNSATPWARAVTMTLTHDLMGKFVRFEIQHRWSLSAAFTFTSSEAAAFQSGVASFLSNFSAPAAASANGIGSFVSLTNLGGTFDNTASFIAAGDVLGEQVANATLLTSHPPPPLSGGTSGTSLVSIVHQALMAPCTTPTAPPGVVAGNIPDPTLTPELADERLYP